MQVQPMGRQTSGSPPRQLWDRQYVKFSLYGFLKNLRFFDPYLLLFLTERGISFFQVGLLFAVREISVNIIEIPSGIIADTFGRRRSMVISFVSYIISFMIFYLFADISWYVLAMIFFAGGEAFRTGTHKAMIIDYLELNGMGEHRVDYYGSTRAWSQRGSALSALIAGAIVFYSGSYERIFLYSVIPYLLNLLLMLSYPKVLDRRGETVSRREVMKLMKEHLRGLAEMIRHPRIRGLMVNFSVFDGVFKAVKDYIQPIIQSFAVSAPVLLALTGEERTALVVAAVYAVLYLLTSSAAKNTGRVMRMFSTKERALDRTFLAGVIMVAGIGVMMHFDIPSAGIVIFVAYYLLENIRRPMAVGYLTNHMKQSMMATGLSGESQFRALLTAVLAPLFGLAADIYGIGSALIAFSALMLVFSMICGVTRIMNRPAASQD